MRTLTKLSFVGFIVVGILFVNQRTAEAMSGCEADMQSQCVTDQPSWFANWGQTCSQGCGTGYVPQEDPLQCDYHTTGCGNGKMIWESWCWCVPQM